jgi:Zn-dependent peptidase ImmA (M78 family)
MPTFNNERLKSARLLAGLSLRQLEEKLSFRVTYNSISKYEKGQMQPDNGTIIKLAHILKVTPGYFFESNLIQLGAIDFRKKSSLTQAEIELIKERTKDKLERYIEAERLLNISGVFNNPVSRRQVKECDKAEEMAEIVRQEWGLGTNPIPNVIEMLEDNEVKVIEVDASEKFDGLSTYINDVIPITVINDSFTNERKRFTALHELGHLMMNLKFSSEKEIENTCHRFAGALLFPKVEAIRTLGEKRSSIAMGELVNIKEEYGISIQATMRRALDLTIIAPVTFKQFCIKMANNKKEEGLGVYKGEERSHRLMQLILRLKSENIISTDKAAALAGISSTEFNSIFYSTGTEDTVDLYNPAGTIFSMAWGEDEPEYTLDDIKTLNPNYESR